MSNLPSYKDISDLIKKGATIEAQEKIMELREATIALQEENFTLKSKIRELEQVLEIRGELVREENAYFRIKDDGKREGPFCLACWDGDRKLVNLKQFAYGVTD